MIFLTNKSSARFRNVQIIFRVTELEKAVIKERMNKLGIKDMGKYLRQLALNGECCIHNYAPVIEQLKEMNYYIGSISRSINQIEKSVNTTGYLHDDDFNDIKEKVEKVKKRHMRMMRACMPDKFGDKD